MSGLEHARFPKAEIAAPDGIGGGSAEDDMVHKFDVDGPRGVAQLAGDVQVGRAGGKGFHEAVGGEIAGELVVVEKQPAQHFLLLGRRVATQAAVFLHQVQQDHGRLRQPQAAVVQHRHLTHFIHAFPPGWRAGLAVHEVHKPGLPCLVESPQKECNLEGIAGLAEAVKLVHGGEVSCD